MPLPESRESRPRIPVTNPFQHGSLIIHAELLVNCMDFRIRVMNEFLSYGLVNSCLGTQP
jgi:hypothetical protein